MADTKTKLRELSVGVSFFYKQTQESITPRLFLDVCTSSIGNCGELSIKDVSNNETKFTGEESQIISNGFKLGKAIKETFSINTTPTVSWEGFNTHSGKTTDLTINKLPFSLKEHSDILDNMGLYNLMNMIMNGHTYKRGLHVFENFAPKELETWFEITRDLLIKLGPPVFHHTGETYTSSATINNDVLTLIFQKSGKVALTSIITDFSLCDYNHFKKLTKPKTREEAFSKWIKQRVESNPKYLDSKKRCAEAAGTAIVSILSQFVGTAPPSMLRLFREDEYYYAKTTRGSVEIYQVPSNKGLIDPLVIKNIVAKIPAHQLNIYTTIENQTSGKFIEFRNELRYSHGQFNGVPEAKFYKAGGDMTALFKLVYSG